MKQEVKHIILFFLGLLLLIFLSHKYDFKIDMTQDQHFTLSKASKKVVNNVNKPTQVIVFLKGDFPSYFKRLANETENLLADFHQQNAKIDYIFINPIEEGEDYVKALIDQGLQPAEINLQKSGKMEQVMVFPWAIIKQGDKEIPVSLLSSAYSASMEDQIEKSIENLEFALTNGLYLMTAKKQRKIAVLKGNGELDDLHIADFLRSVGKKYRLAPFTLDSVAVNPAKTLEELQEFQLAVMAKPTEKFDKKEKYVLDQYLMNGGKLLLLIDAVKAHKDTLMYRGKTYALNAELNLTDLLFTYGVRINPKLVKDLIAAPVVLKVGQVGNKPQLEQFPWLYSPLAQPNKHHPIGKNLEMVKLDFVSPIDTLKNAIDKTILLTSSPKTQLVGVPTEINFEEIGKKPDLNLFTAGIQTFGVLLEGRFKSAYNHRVKPFKIDKNKEIGQSAMIIISDGDIIKNQVDKGQPLPLGYDKWSKLNYDNKQFLLNAVDYLMDKTGVISLKNKEVKLKFLDQNKIIAELRFWQWLNFLTPLLLIGIFGFMFHYWRQKKYTHSIK